MVGSYITCLLTLWLMAPNFTEPVPHSGEFSCKVLQVNTEKVPTGLPTEYLVDCTDRIDWLQSDHPNIFWTRNCKE